MRLHFFFMLLSGLVLSGGAVAAPATYTLPVVAMVDSNGDPVGTITGSFVYDIGTEQVSSHNITAVYNGTTYSPQVLGTPVDTTNSVVWARFMVANEVGAFGVYIPVTGLLEGGEGEVGGAAQMGYGDCLSLDGNGLCEWITPVHGYSPKSYSLVSPVSPPSVPVPTLPFYVLLALGGLVGLFGLRKLKK